MKGIIIYKSKYGSARQYAQWIGNDLNFPVVDAAVVNTEKIKEADVIIIGSSIYMGKALIKRWLRKNRGLLIGKQVFLFFVSGTPANKSSQLDKYASTSVPAGIRETAHLFFFPGKMLYRRLSWFDRLLLRMGAQLMKKNGDKNILKDYNELKREHVNELVGPVRAWMNRKNQPLEEPLAFPF
jgi:menaquinone-dependent protoporphyrinogen IX oxidase